VLGNTTTIAFFITLHWSIMTPSGVQFPCAPQPTSKQPCKSWSIFWRQQYTTQLNWLPMMV